MWVLVFFTIPLFCFTLCNQGLDIEGRGHIPPEAPSEIGSGFLLEDSFLYLLILLPLRYFHHCILLISFLNKR
jgi:hypothetical protein